MDLMKVSPKGIANQLNISSFFIFYFFLFILISIEWFILLKARENN